MNICMYSNEYIYNSTVCSLLNGLKGKGLFFYADFLKVSN